jgi:hypothetical protein
MFLTEPSTHYPLAAALVVNEIVRRPIIEKEAV